jgi:hypothetical protein
MANESSEVRSGALSSFSGSGSSALISMQSGPSLEGESSRVELSPLVLIQVTSSQVKSSQLSRNKDNK